MFCRLSGLRFFSVLFSVMLATGGIGHAQASSAPVPVMSVPNPNPPLHTVKLIFIHHSTGENWLRDNYGLLGKTLGLNHYFVSDTNYGWGPNSIGDRTDIPNWPEWFRSSSTPTYMTALLAESGQHSTYTRTLANPGGQNTIIMFKSCFPNSDLEGNPSDSPDPTPGLTVGHAKWVYIEILKYFRTRPDKLFIVITAPPLRIGSTTPAHAANARAFNNWLYSTWLIQNSYPFSNVAVFDFYNVLTAAGAHHRYYGGAIQHVATSSNTLAYPSGDDHPSIAGSIKAKNEFVPLLNIFYNRWKADDVPQTQRFYSTAAQDGWIREYSENSNSGGTLNAGEATFNVGDDAWDRQYRAILSFNTAPLPNTAVITKVTLQLRLQATAGTSPFTTHGNLLVDIRSGAFSANANLQPIDFQAVASKNAVGTIPKTPVSGWYTTTWTSGISGYISNTGFTQLRLRFTNDDNDDMGADYLKFYSGNAGVSYQPQLIIEYYVP